MTLKDAVVPPLSGLCWLGVYIDEDTELVTIPKKEFLDLLDISDYKTGGESRFLAYHCYKGENVTIAKIVYEHLLTQK